MSTTWLEGMDGERERLIIVCGGGVIEIHGDSLEIKPRISVINEKGVVFEYGVDGNGGLVGLSNPEITRWRGGASADDGEVISEGRNAAERFKDGQDSLMKMAGDDREDRRALPP